MGALEDVISDAKKQYLADHRHLVEGLGLSLACGITRVRGKYAICANVYYPDVESARAQAIQDVAKILPSEYLYNGTRVPVEIRHLQRPAKR